VKRISILLVLLMALMAACGSTESSPSATVAPTTEPTAEATESAEPTAEASEPEGSGDTGSEGDLADFIPDEFNGQPGTPIPGMDQLMASMLQQQGVGAENIEFQFVTYGEGDAAVVLTAFRVPGMNDVAMEQFARILSGVQDEPGVEAEEVTVGGKSVLRMSAAQAGEEGVIYMYFAEGAAFTVVSQDLSSAEQLLSELP
jgi:hypothetical protein